MESRKERASKTEVPMAMMEFRTYYPEQGTLKSETTAEAGGSLWPSCTLLSWSRSQDPCVRGALPGSKEKEHPGLWRHKSREESECTGLAESAPLHYHSITLVPIIFLHDLSTKVHKFLSPKWRQKHKKLLLLSKPKGKLRLWRSRRKCWKVFTATHIRTKHIYHPPSGSPEFLGRAPPGETSLATLPSLSSPGPLSLPWRRQKTTTWGLHCATAG